MADKPPPRKGGNFLTQRAGPLPVWAWGLGIGVGGVGLYRYIKAKQAASATTATSAPAPSTSAGWSPPLGGWGGGGGPAGGTPAPGPVPSTTGSGDSTGGQAIPPQYVTPPVSPNGTPAPIIGSSGQPLPGGNVQPGDIFLPQPAAGSGFGGTQAAAANLGAGQSGVLPNGLRVTRGTDASGHTTYTYS